MAKHVFGLMLLVLLIDSGRSFIVPQEVPSLLSLVYSNIPPVKKGTDSRVGFGYRLGEHADFQVMFELGPQLNTKPLGGGSSSENSKRNVNQNDYVPQKSTNPVGSKYLSTWSQDMKQQQHQKQRFPTVSAGGMAAPMRVPTVPYIEESALRQLQQLYKPQPASQAISGTPTHFIPASPDTIGTLPAASMDEIVAQLNKLRFGNGLEAKPTKIPTPPRNQAKITADLMDIDLS